MGARHRREQKPVDQQPTATGTDVLRPDRTRATELPITLKKLGVVNCGNCLTFTVRLATVILGGRGRLEPRQLGASTWD